MGMKERWSAIFAETGMGEICNMKVPNSGSVDSAVLTKEPTEKELADFARIGKGWGNVALRAK